MIDNEYFCFNKLLWDTENLRLDTFLLLLKKDLSQIQLSKLNFIFDVKGLIYIKNATQFRENSKFIGLNTNAVLYDTNLFFKYNVKNEEDMILNEYNYEICPSLKIEIKDFAFYEYSRFYKDIRLRERSKNDVYSDWIKNAQSIKSKMFLTIKKQNNILGYILYEIKQSTYTIELISIKKEYQNMKLGTRLIYFLKKHALKNKVSSIFVGTQISNIKAINFYIRNGFHVMTSTDIYHWWNTK